MRNRICGGSTGLNEATARKMGEAERAVRAIGTNGLPFLLNWIKCETRNEGGDPGFVLSTIWGGKGIAL